MWELDHKDWAPKNWCSWTVVLDKPLRVPWTARRSNQSILKEINSEYSVEGLGLGLKMKLKYFGHVMQGPTHWKRPWYWERFKAGGEGGNRGRDGWMASPTQWRWSWANSQRWWRTAKPGVLQSMEMQRIRHDWATQQQQTFTRGSLVV